MLFIRILVSSYSLSVEHYGLRSAIIAFICRQYEIGTREDHLESCGNAYAALKTKISEAVNIDECTLFASYFLALYTSSERQTYLTNVRGCLALAQHIYDRDYRVTSSRKVPSLWYFIRISLLRRHTADLESPQFEEFMDQFNRILGPETFNQFNSSFRMLGPPYNVDYPAWEGLFFDDGETILIALRRVLTLSRYAR